MRSSVVRRIADAVFNCASASVPLRKKNINKFFSILSNVFFTYFPAFKYLRGKSPLSKNKFAQSLELCVQGYSGYSIPRIQRIMYSIKYAFTLTEDDE